MIYPDEMTYLEYQQRLDGIDAAIEERKSQDKSIETLLQIREQLVEHWKQKSES